MHIFGNLEKLNHYGYYVILVAALASTLSRIGAQNCIYLLLALGLFRYYKFKAGIKNPDFVITIGVVLFFVGLLLSSSFAPNWPNGYHETRDFFKVMLEFFVTYLFVFINDRRQLSAFIAGLAISISIPAVYAIYQGIYENLRASAFLNHPNFFAFFLEIYIPLLYVATIERGFLSNKKIRIITGMACATSIVALIYTGSRGAWLAVGMSFIIYILIKVKANKKLALTLLIVCVITSAAVLQSSQIRDRLNTMFDPNFVSNSERILMWQSALAMWRDYPLTGIGLNNYRQMADGKYMSPLYQEAMHPHAHNSYLSFLAETGLIGFSGFLILFAGILYQSLRNINHPLMKMAFLITCTLLLHSMTDYNIGYRPAMMAYWFILGVLFSSAAIIPAKDVGVVRK